MYLLIVLIVLIVLILFLFLFKYHELFTNNTNNLDISYNDLYAIDNDLKKPRIIYTKIDGNYTKIVNGDFNLNNINSGFYNYKYNYIGLLSNNNIYKYNLYNNKLSSPIVLNDYFKGIKQYNIKKINCLLYLNNLIYIFSNKSILIYDLTKDKTLKVMNSKDLFEKIPNNINYCFINYNDIEKYNALPYIYIIKNDITYKYKFNGKKFKYITKNIKLPTNIKLINNTKLIKVEENGLYRIICVGAGNINGGYGGIIFNDIKLIKNDTLKCIIGKSGDRIPVKDTNNNSKIPFTGSCSGSGATSIYKNDKLILVSGGGGGWCSEIIKAPNICNSLNYFKKQKLNSNIFIPIKKIIIKGDNNGIYKIGLKKIDIKINNFEEVEMDITESPKYDVLELKEKKYLYETSYNKKGNNCSIIIEFNECLIDYEIKIDYKFISNTKINESLIIVDEQNRQYNIDKIRNNLTSHSILTYLSNNKLPTKNNLFAKNGESLSHNKSLNKINNNKNFFYLKGGFGGKGSGGDCISNKYNYYNYCGGGGGWKGGKGISFLDSKSNLNYPTEYVGGCGGSSYIDNLTIKKNDFIYDQFINNYNEQNGFIILNKIV